MPRYQVGAWPRIRPPLGPLLLSDGEGLIYPWRLLAGEGLYGDLHFRNAGRPDGTSRDISQGTLMAGITKAPL
jgi:hypothetical protein